LTSRARLFAGACALLSTSLPALAFTNEFIAFSIENYTGYVLASDALNADTNYNRDVIRIEADVRYTHNGVPPVQTNEYRLDVELKDSQGSATRLSTTTARLEPSSPCSTRLYWARKLQIRNMTLP
jgi:hypothetical protein